MDKDIKEIIDIVNKEFVLNINPLNLKSIKLYDAQNTNEFQRYLINSRIRLFQKLMLLNSLEEECQFVFATTNLIAEKYNFETECNDEKNFGVTIIKESFSRKETFEYILNKLGFLAVTTKNRALPYLYSFFKKNGEIKKEEGWERWMQDNIFILINPGKELIITESEVLYNKDDKETEKILNNIISYQDIQFTEFLERYKDKCVPHEIYIDWIMKWFPGKIHINYIN